MPRGTPGEVTPDPETSLKGTPRLSSLGGGMASPGLLHSYRDKTAPPRDSRVPRQPASAEGSRRLPLEAQSGGGLAQAGGGRVELSQGTPEPVGAWWKASMSTGETQQEQRQGWKEFLWEPPSQGTRESMSSEADGEGTGRGREEDRVDSLDCPTASCCRLLVTAWVPGCLPPHTGRTNWGNGREDGPGDRSPSHEVGMSTVRSAVRVGSTSLMLT